MIARYNGGGGDDRSVDNVEASACCWRGGVCICSAGEREGDVWWRCHGGLIVSIYRCSVGPASSTRRQTDRRYLGCPTTTGTDCLGAPTRVRRGRACHAAGSENDQVRKFWQPTTQDAAHAARGQGSEEQQHLIGCSIAAPRLCLLRRQIDVSGPVAGRWAGGIGFA